LVTAHNLLIQQHADDLGRVPALCAGGGQHVGRGLAGVGKAHPAEQRLQFGGDRRGRGQGNAHERSPLTVVDVVEVGVVVRSAAQEAVPG
jgi:hypothetical protein